MFCCGVIKMFCFDFWLSWGFFSPRAGCDPGELPGCAEGRRLKDQWRLWKGAEEVSGRLSVPPGNNNTNNIILLTLTLTLTHHSQHSRLWLGSGPNDHVFVYFTDHGAPGILAFPNNDVSTTSASLSTPENKLEWLPIWSGKWYCWTRWFTCFETRERLFQSSWRKARLFPFQLVDTSQRSACERHRNFNWRESESLLTLQINKLVSEF